MKLNKLSLKDKKIFDNYLRCCRWELSVYNFANIYIWKGLFEISWAVINDSLCVFFRDKSGAFLYLPALGKHNNPRTTEEIFKILDNFNKNKNISRIENIESKDAPFYENLGYICRKKSDDYVCLSDNLASLSGDKFKSKRASSNYFRKNYAFEYMPFSLKQRRACLELYADWSKQRKSENHDTLYTGMLEDSENSLKIALDNYAKLNLSGRIVKVDKKIKGFTFGYELNNDTFCILYEITDLSVKGLAQFIFSRFSRDLGAYKYINIMDDSGLENLKRVKFSYHPVKQIPAHIVSRQNA